MSSYLVTNKSTGPVHLADLGITLERKGSSTIILSEVFDRSESAKKYRSILLVKPVNLYKPYPFSKPQLSVSGNATPSKVDREHYVSEPLVINDSKKPDLETPSVQSNENAVPVSRSEFNALMAKLDLFITTSSQLMQSKPIAQSGGSTVSLGDDFQEPVYIPASVMPESATTNIVVSQDSIDRDDLDSTLSALSKLKKSRRSK